MENMPVTYTPTDDANIPTDAELRRVAELARKQIGLEREIAQREAELKEFKESLRKVSEEELPAAVDEAGLSEFRLADGRKLTIKPEYHASISEANREAAFKWLRDNKLDGVIKSHVYAEFGRGDDAKAAALVDFMKAAGFEPHQEETIHHQTLKALVKEQIEKGINIPGELFGLHIISRAKVSAK